MVVQAFNPSYSRVWGKRMTNSWLWVTDWVQGQFGQCMEILYLKLQSWGYSSAVEYFPSTFETLQSVLSKASNCKEASKRPVSIWYEHSSREFLWFPSVFIVVMSRLQYLKGLLCGLCGQGHELGDGVSKHLRRYLTFQQASNHKGPTLRVELTESLAHGNTPSWPCSSDHWTTACYITITTIRDGLDAYSSTHWLSLLLCTAPQNQVWWSQIHRLISYWQANDKMQITGPH